MIARPTPRSLHVLEASPSRLPAARRRRQLLDVAVEVFASGGFHGTSMDDVATAAGVTKPVLYQHFGSKRELYIELLDDVGTQLQDAVSSATAHAQHPRAQVERGFAAYFSFVASHESAFLLLFGGGSARDDDFAVRVRMFEASMADFIASLIAADVDDAHRRTLAHGIVGMAEAACRHWLAGRHANEGSGRPATSPEALAAQIAELAWAGLRGVTRKGPD